LNPQPPDRQSERSEFEVISEPEVTGEAIDVSTTVCPENANSDGETAANDFAVALAMIASLPLSPNEKFDGVRMLLGGKNAPMR
jgi:hypothetical protein